MQKFTDNVCLNRCLPMLGPLGEDFAKVKASITTALDKITQVLKIPIKMVVHSRQTKKLTSGLFSALILSEK